MNDLEIAKTISHQIGHKALYMIGAKNLVAEKNGLSFKIGRNSKCVNYIQITLNALDLYKMTFCYISAKGYKVVSEVENIYFDQLNNMIERYTGLYTHL